MFGDGITVNRRLPSPIDRAFRAGMHRLIAIVHFNVKCFNNAIADANCKAVASINIRNFTRAKRYKVS